MVMETAVTIRTVNAIAAAAVVAVSVSDISASLAIYLLCMSVKALVKLLLI